MSRADRPPHSTPRPRCRRTVARRPALLAALLAALLLGACGTPTWSVDVAPPGGQVLQDGRVVGREGFTAPVPYYGVTELAVVPDPAPADAPVGSPPLPYASERRFVEIPPPVSPWLFPLDFVLELVRAPFVDDRVTAVELAPKPRATPQPGDPSDEADLDALRDRARQRIVER